MEPWLLPRILPTPPQEPASRPRGAWPTFSMIVSVVAGSLLILLLGRLSSPLAPLFRPLSIGSISDCLLLAVAALLALVIHETGHLLAALCCRFEVLSVSLGLFRFTRAASGWRLLAVTRRVFTGSVSALPRTNESWRERMLVVVAAGPAATLAGILLAVSILPLVSSAWPSASFFLQALIQIGFVIFVLGLVPNASAAPAQNDATLFLHLWRDGKESNAIFLYHLVLQHQRNGLEPREFPLWLVELMATFEGRADFMVLYAGMIASWAFDRADHRSGDLWDRRALQLSQQANTATRHACLANSACFDLVFRHDLAAARNKLAQVEIGSIGSLSLQHRAQAARDLACGRIARSLAEMSAARTFLPAHLQSRGYEWSLLKRLHATALATLQSNLQLKPMPHSIGQA